MQTTIVNSSGQPVSSLASVANPVQPAANSAPAAVQPSVGTSDPIQAQGTATPGANPATPSVTAVAPITASAKTTIASYPAGQSVVITHHDQPLTFTSVETAKGLVRWRYPMVDIDATPLVDLEKFMGKEDYEAMIWTAFERDCQLIWKTHQTIDGFVTSLTSDVKRQPKILSNLYLAQLKTNAEQLKAIPADARPTPANKAGGVTWQRLTAERNDIMAKYKAASAAEMEAAMNALVDLAIQP